MTQIAPSIDYSDRDLASLRSRFHALIKSVFPQWTDMSAANLGQILLDLTGWTGDVLGFAQDAQAAEAFLETATQRRSLLKLAAQLGYRPAGATAASTVATFTAIGILADTPIPAGTVVKTLDPAQPISFQTLSPITLTVAAPSASVTVENSTSVSESFASTGQPSLSIQLSQGPYLDGTLSITTSQGLFTEAKTFSEFAASNPSAQVFTVKADDYDRATVTFGDGIVAGIIPVGSINCGYKIGGGKTGNAAAGSIVAIQETLTDIHGATVSVSCTNALAAKGGVDRESADLIRVNAPASITAPAMAVGRRDYEIFGRKVDGVDRILALTSNDDENVPYNTVYLYGVFTGAPNMAVLDRVRRQFLSDDGSEPYPLPATTALRVFVAPLVDVDITAKVFLKPGAVPATVGAAVRAALATLFATKITNADGTQTDNPLIDFGYYLRTQSASSTPIGVLAASDVENAIRDTPGLREVGPNPADLTLGATRRIWDPVGFVFTTGWSISPDRQDIQIDRPDSTGFPAAANFPRLGTVVITDGDTGLPL